MFYYKELALELERVYLYRTIGTKTIVANIRVLKSQIISPLPGIMPKKGSPTYRQRLETCKQTFEAKNRELLRLLIMHLGLQFDIRVDVFYSLIYFG